METLEGEIPQLEKQLKDKNEALNASDIEPVKLTSILKNIETLTAELDEKTMRWLELSERKEA